MKKKLLIKSFIIVITAILTITVTVYAEAYLAKDVTYEPSDSSWHVDNVDSALSSLYTTSNGFKNLSTPTTVSPSNLISGETAYNNQGSLVTGTLSPNCITGTFIYTQNDVNNANNGNGYVLFKYIPKMFIIESNHTDGYSSLFYYNSNYNANALFIATNPSSGQIYHKVGLTDDRVQVHTNNNTVTVNWFDGRLGKPIYYIACR